MFTPRKFPKKPFPSPRPLTGGYNMTAVDEFLDPDGGIIPPCIRRTLP